MMSARLIHQTGQEANDISDFLARKLSKIKYVKLDISVV